MLTLMGLSSLITLLSAKVATDIALTTTIMTGAGYLTQKAIDKVCDDE